jgi:hypothetical protein
MNLADELARAEERLRALNGSMDVAESANLRIRAANLRGLLDSVLAEDHQGYFLTMKSYFAAGHDRRSAERLKPAADINLGVAFAAKVERMGLVGLGWIPFEYSQLGVATVNHKPAHRR